MPRKVPARRMVVRMHPGQFDLYRVGIAYEDGKLFSLFNEETA